MESSKENKAFFDKIKNEISIKYALSDMRDYDRLKRYLARTGKYLRIGSVL